MSADSFFVGGTRTNPRFCDGPAEERDDIRLSQRYFAYEGKDGPVVGKTFSVTAAIESPAQEVWRCFKDFNLWQNGYGHYYSEVLGDSEGRIFRFSNTPNEADPQKYRLLKVEKAIPERLVVLIEETPIRDVHTFMLTEHGGRTAFNCLMQHTSVAKDAADFEKLYAQWREVAAESQRKWRDIFVPTLRKLVYRHS